MRIIFRVGRARLMRRVTFLLGAAIVSLFWFNILNLMILSKADAVSLQIFKNEAFYGLETSQQYIYHVSKECAPVVAFGGVGQMLGELVDAQASTLTNTSIVVILPNYGFLRPAEVVARVSYTIASRRLHTDVFFVRYGNDLTFFLVSPPSNHPLLWSGTRVEDSYNLPRGLKADTRDVYFSFVAGEIIKARMERHSKRPAYVHSHGATNAPVNYFLRLSVPSHGNLKLIYTAHDYNSEPYITYRSTEVNRYAPQLLNCNRPAKAIAPSNSKNFGCNPSKNHPETQILCMHGKHTMHATYFVSCADAFSTVSHGMKSNLMHASMNFASLLLNFEKSRYVQVSSIGNWVSDELWKSARERVSLLEPSRGKHEAKLRLSSIFRKFGVGSFSTEACVVGWTGRFETNKGSRLLPSILQVACDAGCILVISGYSTNSKMQKYFETVTLRQLKNISRENSCTFLLLGTKEDQRAHSMVIRAATDITIVPSYSEGFGLVAAEALAFGSIPVVSEVGGLPDIIRPLKETDDGIWTGLQFPMFDKGEEETSLSLSVSLSKAVDFFKNAQSANSLDALQRRIIRSTPLRGESLGKYNSLYQLVQWQ